MRFISKLTMTVAAIFFALSVSSPVSADQKELDEKVYQVCKKWRVDKGGPMPVEVMQHCITVLTRHATDDASNGGSCGNRNDSNGIAEVTDADCVNASARAYAKRDLGYW